MKFECLPVIKLEACWFAKIDTTLAVEACSIGAAPAKKVRRTRRVSTGQKYMPATQHVHPQFERCDAVGIGVPTFP